MGLGACYKEKIMFSKS